MSEKLRNLPKLGGWVNLTEAASILGISRQHAYRRAKLQNDGKPGGFYSAHRVGKSSYVVALRELRDELSRKGTPRETPDAGLP